VIRLLRLAALVGIAVWLWRRLTGRGEPTERAGLVYADGSSVVLEPGSPGFDRLAAAARSALGR
jgi:hypothetical protein